ncbi:hypothetical protein YC2023_074959 [Brassica napus]
MKPSGNQDNTITFIPSLFCEPEGRYPIEREGDVTPHHHHVAFTVWGTLCHRRCNTVLETSLAVRYPSPVSYGRAADPRGFDVEKRRTYTEPSRRALPVPIITKSATLDVIILKPKRDLLGEAFSHYLRPWLRDYVSERGFRDVWTSDAALVGGGSDTSGLATHIVWSMGAETFAFDAALEGGGILAKSKDLIKSFGSDDHTKICLDKGELQVAGKERESQFSSQFRDISTIVMQKTLNPETQRRYTISMVERLMHEIHFAVDPHSNSKKQVSGS